MRASLFLPLLLLPFFVGCGEEEQKKSVPVTVEYGERNVSEPFYFQQWYLDINQSFYAENGIDEDAHISFGEVSTLYTGKGVKVAVIDFGLDVTHEDLAGAIFVAKNIETNGSDVADDYSWDNHGTAVTGIIGARRNQKGILGIAPESEIIFIKMPLDTNDAQMVGLFEEANRSGADIINCSWGTYHVSDTLKATIDNLAENGRDGKGTVIVFSAGNDDKPMRYDESAIPSVIGVGATDASNLRAEYSNYGAELDIVAPGGNRLGITTLDVSGVGAGQSSSSEPDYLLFDDTYGFAGTSASAPIVSGAIALLLEADPTLTRQEIQEILQNSADKIGATPYTEGKNIYYGYGKLNLKRALETALQDY